MNLRIPIFLLVLLGSALTAPAASAGERIANVLEACAGGSRPALMVTVEGIRTSTGTLRVQSYRATKADWLKKGHWLTRIEAPARAGQMTFCVPVKGPGQYAIAVRHDVNGNGKTDLTKDGGGMSNNPSISIWNLGRPSYTKVAVPVNGTRRLTIRMRYM